MNGFVLVLDRLTGKLFFAKDFTYLNGGRVDLETGWPVLTAQPWYGSPKNIYPFGPGHGTCATRTELVPARIIEGQS